MLLLLPAAVAQNPAAPNQKPVGAIQVLKAFDFNEQPLGNYEDMPMYWTRHTGDGLPRYCGTAFDNAVGHDAPPSFRFDLRGANVGVEYTRDDILVEWNADYRVTAYARTDDLESARAFLSVHFVDREGNTLPETAAVTNLTAVQSSTKSTWQELSLTTTAADPAAHALRIQLWLVQDYTWEPIPETALDPIVREDVRGTVWFDDIVITRLPRATLLFSERSGVAVLPDRGKLELTVQNPTDAKLRTQTVIRNNAGEQLKSFERNVAPNSVLTDRYQIPVLPYGAYYASTAVFNGDEYLLQRETHFTILNPAPSSTNEGIDFGVDLGQVAVAENAGLANALETLGATTAKISVPFVDSSVDPAGLEWVDGIADLATTLAARGIESCAVALPPPYRDYETTQQFIRLERDLDRYFGPVFSRLGGAFNTWQLDHDRTTATPTARWTAGAVDRFREELTKFISLPRLIQPVSVFESKPTEQLLRELVADKEKLELPRAALTDLLPGTELNSLWIPATVPTQALPWQLAFLTPTNQKDDEFAESEALPHKRHWANFESAPTAGDRYALADYAHRIIIARALAVRRAIFPAPLTAIATAGAGQWAPTAEYPVTRTLFHALRGKHATAILPLPNESLGILFRDSRDSTLVVWSWDLAADFDVRHLYLGEAPRVRDLWSNVDSLQLVRGRGVIPITYLPILIENVDGALLQMQTDIAVEPLRFAPQERSPKLRISLHNPYTESLSGEMIVTAPPEWSIYPGRVPVAQPPDRTVEREFSLVIPPVELNDNLQLTVQLALVTPIQRDLEFHFPLDIALDDIDVNIVTLRRSTGLVMQVHLRNSSSTAISFAGFCQPPGMRRQEAAFIDVKSGETRKVEFAIPNADALVGHDVVIGLDEVDGNRRIFRRVRVPEAPATTPDE